MFIYLFGIRFGINIFLGHMVFHFSVFKSIIWFNFCLFIRSSGFGLRTSLVISCIFAMRENSKKTVFKELFKTLTVTFGINKPKNKLYFILQVSIQFSFAMFAEVEIFFDTFASSLCRCRTYRLS